MRLQVLILIILLGGVLRFTYINWDSFQSFHPDERNISWAVTRIRFFSQMNPQFFAYGGLPVYLYRAIGEVVVRVSGNPDWLFDWGHIAVIGRYISATLSTISILLIYFVGSLYFSRPAGLASAAFLAFSPWAIREAHFSTTETMLVFFLLLLLLFAKKITMERVLILGVVWGVALGAKTTSLLFGIIPLAAIWIPDFLKKFSRKFLFTVLLFAAAGLFFFLFSPYTILDFGHFRESMTYETGVALGRLSVPYALQFVGTMPYLYQITTMLWQAGPLVIVGLLGLILLALQKKYIVFLLFPLLYFTWAGSWFAKFSRYNVPLLPFITLAAAWLSVALIKRFRVAGLTFTALLLFITFLWGMANWRVYMRPQTKIEATKWIYDHIPTETLIYTEHWNDGLPLDLPDEVNRVYYDSRELLNVYDEPDNEEKKAYYADKLAAGDYILFSTRRIWATMPKLKEKYPVTSFFYERLLRGELGYAEVKRFTSYPKLFGWEVNDDSAEESVQVFDHPTVRIFQNTEYLSKEEIYKRLMSSMGS